MGYTYEKETYNVMTLAGDPKLSYYLYVPEGEIKGVWVTVHGVSVNAYSHISMLAPFAKKGGFILAAPIFSKEDCLDYNIFGKAESGFRSDKKFMEIMAEVGAGCGVPTEKIYLMGYSGGGQFCHRFIMNYPDRVKAAIICSPGNYTFPTWAAEYPYGLTGMEECLGTTYDEKAFLSLPIFVNVGSEDVLRTANLLQREDIDRDQGYTRVERAERWFRAVEARTKELGITADHRIEILQGVGHGFEKTMENTNLGELSLRFFQAHMEG